MFLAIKTEDGTRKGKISFYCKNLGVTRQGFHNDLKYKNKPWKYQSLADAMLDICAEDECNILMGESECTRRWNESSLMVSKFPANGPFTGSWKKLASVIGQRENQMESRQPTERYVLRHKKGPTT